MRDSDPHLSLLASEVPAPDAPMCLEAEHPYEGCERLCLLAEGHEGPHRYLWVWGLRFTTTGAAHAR